MARPARAQLHEFTLVVAKVATVVAKVETAVAKVATGPWTGPGQLRWLRHLGACLACRLGAGLD